jgi:multiple sugar transport system substrate-binding protein
VTGWKAGDIRGVFNQGNAVFMRDFFDGYQPSQDASQSKVVGKVAVKPMVAASGQKGAGCLGNWYMGISSFSKNPDTAWEVVKYLTGAQGSAARALGSGLPPANKLALQDKALQDKYPSFAILTDVLATAKPRPVTPAYNQISADIIQVQVSNALTKKSTPKDAVQAMANKAGPLLAKFK